jgi:hypothetical protein
LSLVVVVSSRRFTGDTNVGSGESAAEKGPVMSDSSEIPTPSIPCPTVEVADHGGHWTVEIRFDGRPVVGIMYNDRSVSDPTLVVWDTEGQIIDEAHNLSLRVVVDEHLNTPIEDPER